MYPTVGRTVHYYPPDDGDVMPAPLAAIIVRVDGIRHEIDDSHGCHEACAKVYLHVFHGQGERRMDNVPWSEEPKRGHWSWPPRV